MDRTLTIDARFEGPSDAGNGGYTGGLLAAELGAPAAAVRIHRPIPLGRALSVREHEGGLRLLDADAVIAEARVDALDVEPPEPPSLAEARDASTRFRGHGFHPFPRCFVCGPGREPGDGLRIFPGPVADRPLVAAPWQPDASHAGGGERVRPEFLWAALDCPGAFASPQPKRNVVVLGELRGTLHGEVGVGERCVVVGWHLRHQGRKRLTATALYGESGACRGLTVATWIEIPRERAGSGGSARG